MTTADLAEELRAVLRHFVAIHEAHEDARTTYDTIAAQVADIRRAYAEKLYREVTTDPQIKIAFSNQERRDIEVQRRLEADIPELLKEEAQARQQKLEAGAETERSLEALKTMRALAGLVEAERRMDAVTMDVASMPRIVSGRR